MYGYYSNYSTILTALNTLFIQGFNSIVGSLGNLILENNKEHSYAIYKNLHMLNAWMYGFFVSAFYSVITPFINVWVGEEYLLSTVATIAILSNFYIQGLRKTINIFKDAAGIFFEDRFMPIIEVIVNIITSIIFVKLIGLAGVFIGTIIGALVVMIYGHAKYVYTPLFGKSRKQFLLEHAKYAVMAIASTAITAFIISFIKIKNTYIQVVVNIIICLIIPNLFYFLVLHRTEEFKYYKNMFKNLINKRKMKAQNDA